MASCTSLARSVPLEVLIRCAISEDLNATKHPLAKVGTFDAAKVPMIRALAKKYGLTWGGDYKNRKDEMHFEIALSPEKVRALITKLGLENAN